MPDHNFPAPRDLAAAPPEAPRRPARRRRWVAGMAILLALAGLIALLPRAELLSGIELPAVRRPAPPLAAAGAPPPALTVAVQPVTPRLLGRQVVGDGSVVAWQELVLGAEIGGLRVVEVAVEEGDRVRQGQVLVRLEDAVLAAQRDQAVAAVTEAEAALRIAQQDLQRAAELVRTNSVPRQTLEQREAATRQAEARLAAAEARRDEAVARLAQTRILAPADGIVTRRVALLGSVVPAGQEMLRLAREGRLELNARVPELELAAVAPGMAVRVTHGERVIEGRVRAIAPTVSAETRLGTVHVALPPESGLRPGMFARAEILAEAAPVLAVPQEAVVFRDGRPAVFVLAEGGEQVALRAIATGRRRDGMVEVREGLAAGERVVVAGAGFLEDGDRVRLAGPVTARRE
ncbi:efflux RND transporter periplasmic adaptor subunit [Crenalkalicoccus roseus]|uniref:efflux RND transporter periplasmic adaptor subunit n=1 Tax=Crenalkalicoccus roseus TaxID=1485588 RepID=UPI001081D8B9|nr:efflux RND transporter periplasmic adaptor subunit [Crenalkalicoccus roseus]